MLSTFFLIINICFFLFIAFLTISFLTGGPFVPSRKKSVDRMIDLARLKPGMKIYDLGSGDGRLLLAAAHKGATAVGLEINPFLVIWSKLRAILSPFRNNISIKWQNLWKSDLSDADVIFMYLLPYHMDTLQKLLQRELKPGSLVVTNTFIFSEWKILRQDKANHIYVFQR